MTDFSQIAPRNEQEYLETRVYDQLAWFDKKSVSNKRWFTNLKVVEIIIALCIPFSAAYITEATPVLKIVVGGLGVSVAAIAGIITLIKFQENWIEYRTIAESLKLEKFLFLAKAGPYKNNKEAFPDFVERFELLISNSNKKWANYISKIEPNDNI